MFRWISLAWTLPQRHFEQLIMPHVCICLATYNGAAFLRKQLDSYLTQSHKDWSLLISDDGSTDGTKQVLKRFISDNPHHDIKVMDGPQEGYARNFLSALCHQDLKGDYFAFSDQDDIWLPDKLSTAILALERNNTREAKLYGGRTIIIDDQDCINSKSPLFVRPPSFQNALVQSIAGGNTMLMNAEARELVQKAGATVDIVSHDWWVYLLISGAGGEVIYDPEPQVLYRNHDNNLIGSNRGLVAKYKRLAAVMENRFISWNERNERAIFGALEHLTNENRDILKRFSHWRQKRGLSSLAYFPKSGLYRQTSLGTATLQLAGFLGKV